MALEDIWNVERGERTEIPFARTFIEAIGCLIESQSRNESFERNAVPLFDLVYEGIETGIDELRDVVKALGHAVEGMEGLLGEEALDEIESDSALSCWLPVPNPLKITRR